MNANGLVGSMGMISNCIITTLLKGNLKKANGGNSYPSSKEMNGFTKGPHQGTGRIDNEN